MGKSAPESVIVVGGGVIGTGIAFELAKRGVSATLVERGRVGGEASWASAGIISLPNRPWYTPERVELNRISLTLYPALIEELEARTGLSLDYRRPGEWVIACDDDRAEATRHVAAWQRSLGYAVEEAPPIDARAEEPSLPEALVAAWLIPDVGSLSVYRLSQAQALAAGQLGATILEETPVGGLLRDGARVTGVRLQDRDLHADATVLATGAWTRLLGQTLDVTLPTKPIKGQLIAFANAPLRPARVIAGHGGYVRPRPDGTTLVAATEEDVGFDRRVTGDGVSWLLDLVRTLCPVLLKGEVAETWTGLRPGTDTMNPLIGPVPGLEGLWVCAGHFRTGAKEAPATATLVAEALATREAPSIPRAFDPAAQGVSA